MKNKEEEEKSEQENRGEEQPSQRNLNLIPCKVIRNVFYVLPTLAELAAGENHL